MAEKQSKPAASAVAASSEQSIEELQRRYQKLHTRKIQAETQRDGAKSRLDELKQQAREKYGTDDLALLQKKLDEIVTDNAQKRATYQADLDKIERALADVDAKFAGDSGTAAR